MATIFSKIVNGEIPCHKIAENREFFAFLDIHDDRLGRMMAFAKKIACAQKQAIPCKRIGMTVIGLEVPHAHIHLVPMQKESDMHFGKEKLEPTSEQLAEVATRIRSKLNGA